MARRASRRLALGCAVIAALAGPAAAQAPAHRLSLTPAPNSATPLPGRPVRFADAAPILVPAGDAGALAAAQYLSAMLARTRGLALPVHSDGAAPAGQVAIAFRRVPGKPAEGYGLEVSPTGARITATTDAGLFYAAVTLWQLMTADGARGPVQIAPVQIDDAPRFAWRGLMVDTARHVQPPAELERIIDVMAAHKLNVLHWHLTDDQGWRLEIRKYPRLTEVGAWRTPPAGSPDGAARYGGFYTQDEVRRIVAYAAERHVMIVPEIEMPGHATSALLAYPQFGAGAAPRPADQTKWGELPYVDKDDAATLGFLEDVLTEVMALFPGRYIHVGGDEADHERWNADPAAQARLRQLGTSDPAALQADLTRQIADFLAAHGRRLVGWDEILAGGDLPPGATVMSWHGVDGALAAAAKGHDAVLAPAPVLYLDNWQAVRVGEPPGRGYLVKLQDVYRFEALPASAPATAAQHVLGLQGNIWTEHVRTGADLEAMAFPRMAAVAEDAWTAPQGKDWTSFVARLPAEFARDAALGLSADRGAVAVTIAPTWAGQTEALALSAPAGVGEIRYTLDGSEPRASSPRYEQPIPAAAPLRVRAALFLDGVRIGPVAEAVFDPAAPEVRQSQDLKLCNDALALNLEGAPGRAQDAPVRRTYLANPVNACWIWPKAELSGAVRLDVAFARLPFNLALAPSGDIAVVRPPRQPGGELEVRQDGCDSDPIAVAELPPGAAGERSEITLPLPPRSGPHDLCFTFTSRSFDPVLALGEVRLVRAPAAKGKPETAK